MRINHNIQALNAYRNLSQTMNSTSKSLEKLSSGLRINKASDDAAGLAISEKMRSQIRGLDMAERNTLDAISLIQTGEGALNEVHSILQRMRELSVQAANGTLETQDRQAIQDEINQLTFEIDRIADTTQFNQKKLFSGSTEGRAFADVNSSQVAYDANGVWKGVVTADPTEPAEIVLEFPNAFGEQTKAVANGQTFTINNLTYEIYSDNTATAPNNGNIVLDLTADWQDGGTDGNSISNINNLIDKLTLAIGQNDSGTFNTSAFVKTSAAEDATNADDDNIINGILKLVTTNPMSPKDAEAIKIDGKPGTVNVLDPVDSSVKAIPVSLVASDTANYTNSFNLTFSDLPKDGDQLKIDNLTILFKKGASAGYSHGPDALNTFNGSPNQEGTLTIDIEGKDIFTILADIDSAIGDIKNNDVDGVLTALSSHDVVGSTLVLSSNRTQTSDVFDDSGSNGLEIALFDGDFEANKGKELTLNFQIGANSSETLGVTLGVMDAGSLGIGRNADGSPTVTGVNAVQGVDVMSETAASAAINIFENAIKIVSAERSKLGAFQNRLEHTTNNLQTANENLTSAESRIRDLDMAEEMTTFTRNNILNQAGQAMLAQANQLPQGILQLLK
ncbi:flagellin [Bacillus sp. DTU_2020_1000418_1_SI_GHA_SEK_038]|uniref:flagellin N-terminal helical domain-containing protein n=1 Tax=Bacillus sp. DTU_2020_1000418_1_SI_GHA_SEK_038 TaxID=3077585 RepID=UPI0028F124B9|nr:flagellin [Bacillus sp. DTU_2020_1000418_1_SI_GHA_SEK_038]WNS75092.1 flagellin [Bacillus sp. DTU_2020_1000418_1_SI_GHA_SEK_038]